MNDKGIALPMAMMVMAVLVALIVTFLVLATSEPLIAHNQMAGAQARALAETGIERALWALTKAETTPGFLGALDPATTNPSPAPYNGGTFLQVSNLGGFTVTVADGPSAHEKVVTAVGWVPNNVSPLAVKKIQVRAIRIRRIDPPCAICAGGESPPGTSAEIRVGGSATVNASPATGASYCPGVTPLAGVMAQGSVTVNGSPNLSAPPGGTATAPNTPGSTFSPFLLTDSDMAYLKGLAKDNGTYYQGNTTFTSPPKDGIVFIDTPSGNPLTPTSPSSDLITLQIHGTWPTGFNGWIIVAGSATIQGDAKITGLVYAQNDVTLNGLGTGAITGAVISTNRLDTSSTNIDSGSIGQAPLTYDCGAIRTGGGSIPQGWSMRPGTFVEQAGR
ncbi:MAG TPA: hypothetical protein VFV05_21655 [Methylomirabilota bacterium]|nr:hypothetical protein [Methylomirabilota bacterium]